MEPEKIDYFFISRSDYFPPEQIPAMRKKMMEMDGDKALMVQSVDYRNPTILLVISILVGELGIDRFLLGDIGLGILKLITFGGCGIWWLIDVILIMKKTREYNMLQFNKYALL
ncbi:MAG: TM2 domain-containing protein [bacterium P3]|nr:MAG: TM2 domain-containing protein [bacterium P3]KWW38672.1 MAG: TM2 domain-containing protein [bacterium F083]